MKERNYRGVVLQIYNKDFERFKRHTIQKDGCWDWHGYLIGTVRRPAIGVCGLQMYAHNFSYLWFVGDIPKGLFVLHSCDNVMCTNPEHLWLGTQSDNVKDSVTKLRHYFTRKALAKQG